MTLRRAARVISPVATATSLFATAPNDDLEFAIEDDDQ